MNEEMIHDCQGCEGLITSEPCYVCGCFRDMTKMEVKMVAAIRADSKVGRGSCSSIDECMEDTQLASWLAKNNIHTCDSAVAFARRMDRIERSVYADRAAAAKGW